jgi:hypothetical protein
MIKVGKLIADYMDTDECEDFGVLTSAMLKKDKAGEGCWRAEVQNFGWRKSWGEKYIRAKNGKDLLSAILPKTDCSFKVHNYGKGIAIQNHHHDSPTGDEWYYIMPTSEIVYRRNT